MKMKILYTLAVVLLTFSHTFAQDNYTKANQTILVIAGSLLLIWMVLVITYLVWAIHKYNNNYGLSNHEWKVLHPEVYAKESELEKYTEIKKQLITAGQNVAELKTAAGEQPETATAPFEEPKENPYKTDSFGLPPNTIRGIIALTALFLFVLMEGVNFFSNTNLEKDFSELILVLQMVVAFYFGSRAVEVFKARSEKAEKKEEETVSETQEKKEVTKNETTGTTEDEEKKEQPVTEKPLLPEEKSTDRIISNIESAKTFEVPRETLNKSIQNRPLPERVLALTGSFETSEGFPNCFAGLSNNFDGQGISFGVLQWNFGQGSLTPLLQKINNNHPDLCKNIFGSLYYDFDRIFKMTKAEQLAWAKSIQYTQLKNGKLRWYIDPNWIKAFRNLGITDEMIEIQTEAAGIIYQKALSLTNEYELTTERGVALLFDIITQNGSVDRNGSGGRIKEDYMKIPPSLSNDEKQTEKMIIIANRRAEVSKSQYVEDVRSRKLTIAKGEGKVHSKQYNLKDEFNITLTSISV